MDEEILSRLLTFKNTVILAIQLKTGKKLITDGNKILAGKISGELASFILNKSKTIEFPTTLKYKDELIYFEPIDIKKYLGSIGKELLDEVITLSDFEEMDKSNVVIVDARAPREYAKKTIPNAINVPIFLDDEHETIGKTYKQEGRDKAMNLASEIIGESIKRITQNAIKIDNNKTIVVFCARGGMRSQAMATIFKLLGFKVKRLIGGFKGYNLTYSIRSPLP
ncbi:selenouridine synthase SelU-like subunit [Methanococcus aeolicus]|uniref:Rhodanese domain protein n=1 Tax=Methanococcus aeolicus (strain ATCC BAA-1280 / DSM 17508 / OCM 812 / Nankai-3) TaxID=419665 RepID=A6UVI6_META3|nr:selenouridine synthase SelU-like subunit [Methanococcus aeolicus]ABR56508.1 Rhodanese domain protein [Methanococcus aeolicus Nankai-3]UXM84517.1 selenouridine synthase SelU-like subunit [Methanococcus aeolicus]